MDEHEAVIGRITAADVKVRKRYFSSCRCIANMCWVQGGMVDINMEPVIKGSTAANVKGI